MKYTCRYTYYPRGEGGGARGHAQYESTGGTPSVNFNHRKSIGSESVEPAFLMFFITSVCITLLKLILQMKMKIG